MLPTAETTLRTRHFDDEGRVAALRRYQILDTPEEEAFDRLTRLARSALRVPMAAIALVDRDRRWFKSVAGGKRGNLPREDSFCNHTIQQLEPLMVPNTLEDARFRDNRLVVSAPKIRAYLGAPLATPDGYQIGSFCCVDVEARTFSEEEIEMMADFARIVMDQLELKKLALFDGLTGVLSRRGFAGEAEKQLARANEHDRLLSLLLLDIDHFKLINDRYGHAVGDHVLRELGSLLNTQLRRSDLVGRMGGEEFAILLPETGETGALQFAERLRRGIAATPFETPSGAVNFSVSVGLATRGDACDSLDALLHRADIGLYRAKNGGRNRTAIAA